MGRTGGRGFVKGLEYLERKRGMGVLPEVCGLTVSPHEQGVCGFRVGEFDIAFLLCELHQLMRGESEMGGKRARSVVQYLEYKLKRGGVKTASSLPRSLPVARVRSEHWWEIQNLEPKKEKEKKNSERIRGRNRTQTLSLLQKIKNGNRPYSS